MLEALDIPKLNQLLFEYDTNYVAEKLVFYINEALDLVAPISTTQLRKSYAPYLTPATKELMMNRNLAAKALSTFRIIKI